MSGLLVSAAWRSSGKTTIATGLIAGLAARGLRVQPFKKGPDYIDPQWLGMAAGRACRNLDLHLQGADEVALHWSRHAEGCDLALVEGNLGLHDGMDLEGADSNAALAATARDSRRPGDRFARHVARSRRTPARDGDVRSRGAHRGRHPQPRGRRPATRRSCARPSSASRAFPCSAPSATTRGWASSSATSGWSRPANSAMRGRVSRRWARRSARTSTSTPSSRSREAHRRSQPAVRADPEPAVPPLRIGIARDRAFGFYYADDLDAFREAGATLVAIDTLNDAGLPDVDGLFIGGGFPEVHGAALAANTGLRESLRRAIDGGLPVYAECGGLMFLARSLTWRGHTWDMVGALPADVVMHGKPVGKGYVRLAETDEHPWGRGEGSDDPRPRIPLFHARARRSGAAVRLPRGARRRLRRRERRHRPSQRAGDLRAPAQRGRKRLGGALPAPRGAREVGARMRARRRGALNGFRMREEATC